MDKESQAVAMAQKLETLLSELSKLEKKIGELATQANWLRSDLERLTPKTLVHG